MTVLDGSQELEVVGESHYQEALWRIVGGRTEQRVRLEITALLVPEPDNRFDSNAIMVLIDGAKAGYLSRDDAAEYRPGLLALEDSRVSRIGLQGVVVGGGIRADGPGLLGVWLRHDPSDFGIEPVAPPLPRVLTSRLRTGLSEARATDTEDDSYDLSWLRRLPSGHRGAIDRLHQLLDQDPDPIDRHFMFCELERRLYRLRDDTPSGLEEYDSACTRHDSEMDGIRDALLAKFGKVPLLETYSQMVIRQQKAKNWIEAIRWARRGLALYGDAPARPEAVEGLAKRITRYSALLDASRKSLRPTEAVSPGGRTRQGHLKVEDLLSLPDLRKYASPAMDPLTEEGALQEAQVLGVRVDALAGVVGILFELRQALQLREANTGVLVARGVRELTWSGPGRDTALTAWSVGGSVPRTQDHLFSLSLGLWPAPGARLSLIAESAAFFIGEVPGLQEAPPDYSDRDRRTISGEVADWGSLFDPVCAVFLDPAS